MRLYRRTPPLAAAGTPGVTTADLARALRDALRDALTSPAETCPGGRPATLADILGGGLLGVLRELLERQAEQHESLIDALDNLAAACRGEADPRADRQMDRESARKVLAAEIELASIRERIEGFGGLN